MTMVWVDLKPGEEGCQPILDFLSGILPDTRSFEGCQDLKVYIEGDGESIVFIEYWESAEHYQRYLSWRTETGVLNQLVEMLAAPLIIRIAEDSGI
ncbi:MAG: antibiotic biosynthesis monooxygenase [Halieaceae bacterium]|nr:antibiotic biosynthesis monooxygenase [Halieaceae bacterium]